MLSPQLIKLAMAMVLSILVLVALTLDVGQSAPAKPLKAKLLRPARSDLSKLTDAEKDYLQTHAEVQEEKKEEREFENKVPGHLPIKVKLRAEKEKAAKDLANDRWYRDLELEVKNIGDKPIRYLSLILEMPEITVGGAPISFILRYGQHSLFDGSKGQAGPQDVALNPGETVALGLGDTQIEGWEKARVRDKWFPPKKIIIYLEEVNFGNGNGFFGDNGAPWPFPKQLRNLSQTFRNKRTNGFSPKAHHSILTNVKSCTVGIGGESVRAWPISFRFEELNFMARAVESEGCCPNDCRYVDILDANYCYYCSEQLRRANDVACLYEFDGICATVEEDRKLCADGVYCEFDRVYACGYVPPSPTPTPTPSPTPEPTCNPAPSQTTQIVFAG